MELIAVLFIKRFHYSTQHSGWEERGRGVFQAILACGRLSPGLLLWPVTVIGFSRPASSILPRDVAVTSIDPVIKLCHIVSIDYDCLPASVGRCGLPGG